MPAPGKIQELVQRFQHNRDAYRGAAYNETETRREFIDPFFKVMGWDVDNEQGYAEAYKEVVHETAVKVQDKSKLSNSSTNLTISLLPKSSSWREMISSEMGMIWNNQCYFSGFVKQLIV